MNDAALAQGFYVLYPAQSCRANAQRCWNWFKHSHQQRGRGEPAHAGGDDPRSDGAACDRSAACVRCRPVGRRRDGGHPRIGLSRPLRRRRRPLGLGRGRCDGPPRSPCRDAWRCLDARRRARPWRAHHRLPWRCRSDRAPGERRAGHCCLYGHGVIRGNPSGAVAARAPARGGSTSMRPMAASSPSIGWFTARPTPGRAATRKAPTPTASARTRPARCCDSSSSIRNSPGNRGFAHGSVTSSAIAVRVARQDPLDTVPAGPDRVPGLFPVQARIALRWRPSHCGTRARTVRRCRRRTWRGFPIPCGRRGRSRRNCDPGCSTALWHALRASRRPPGRGRPYAPCRWPSRRTCSSSGKFGFANSATPSPVKPPATAPMTPPTSAPAGPPAAPNAAPAIAPPATPTPVPTRCDSLLRTSR